MSESELSTQVPVLESHSPSLSSPLPPDPYARIRKYECFQVLGQGTYGTVYKAKNGETGEIVALKIMKMANKDDGITPNALREVAILRSLKYPNIVRLIEAIYCDSPQIENPVIVLVFEFFECDLKQHIINHYGVHTPVPENKAARFTLQILIGLHQCHVNSIMHRDLKPHNLLVDSKSEILKIADFGLSRTFSIPPTAYTHEVVTLWYRAPEILLGAHEYSSAIDVWSAGCIFAEMLLGRPIFSGANELEQILAIFSVLGTPDNQSWPSVESLPDWISYPKWFPTPLQNLNWPKPVEKHALDLLGSMLVCYPSKRITARQAVHHPYFDNIRNDYPHPVDPEVISQLFRGSDKENISPSKKTPTSK